jgi:aminoglycoside phosphotransferase (APT) family kinase protein
VLGFDLSETEGAVLLLAAYMPSPPPDDWTERGYVQVIHQLGRLHGTFWGKTTESELPDWLRAKPGVTRAQCQAAAMLWRALGERDDLREALAPNRRSLESLLMNIPALDLNMPTTPATLCHGDFHAGNLLQGPTGEWIWADWQEVRLGPGVDDLAFFWQRAFAEADTPPPHDAMVKAYAAGLATVDGPLISREQVDRALAWAELRSWLVDWPGYLGALSTARIARVLRRIDTLMSRLERGSHLYL